MIKFIIDEKAMRADHRVPQWIKDDPSILIPRRSTKGSAGYDVVVPYDFEITGGVLGSFILDTFVSLEMDEGYYAAIHVRSSIGIKRYIRLLNSTAIIDSDFKDSIKIPLRKFVPVTDYFSAGDRIAQIVFSRYFLTDEDKEKTTKGVNKLNDRNGGIGSTGPNIVINKEKLNISPKKEG